MKTLIVGGNGFVGSYLMKEIKADNLDSTMDIRNGINKRYKTIIFLACKQEETRKAYQYNYEMYLALDEYRQKYPKTHLIFFSSTAVHFPISIYCQTKRLGEVYAKRFKYHTILRPSNIYGHGDGHGAVDRFMRGEKVIFGDGEQVRDFIAIEEVIDIVKEHLFYKQVGTFNVTTGVGTTMNQAFKMFGEGEPIHKKVDVGVMGKRYISLRPGRVW